MPMRRKSLPKRYDLFPRAGPERHLWICSLCVKVKNCVARDSQLSGAGCRDLAELVVLPRWRQYLRS